MRSSYTEQSDDDRLGVFTEEVAASLTETLTKIKIPLLSAAEQLRLANIIDCCALVEKHRRSMDDNATRYMLFFRSHILRRGHSNPSDARISWREITWAYHSNSQDILVDLVSRQFHGRMLWTHARESGMFMWLQDPSAIVGSPLLINDLSAVQIADCFYSRKSTSRISLGINIQARRRRTPSTAACIISR
jgi:hypothetical protein